ncbi:MAG: TIGR00366 family protein [Negativicutes bacterium]|nr:TIGR00366 family protein [Negativicutes bacterium]
MQSMTKFFTGLMRKYLPDPFVFAIVLTFLTLILGVALQQKSPFQMVEYWGKGFWSLLPFTTQMATMLATGYVLARAPFVDKGVDIIVKFAKTPRMAIAVATVVGGVGSYLNWGFGLIVGALVARRLAMSIKGVHYPLIMAAAYSGFVFYGTGFTGTIPILIATKGHPFEKSMGLVPLTDTIFSAPILIMTVILLITLPILNAMSSPKNPKDIIEIDPSVFKDQAAAAQKVETDQTFAEKMNNSKLLSALIGLVGLGYLAYYFHGGGALDINMINFAIIFLGVLLMGTPAKYIAALSEGAKTVGGIILQYPFYAGIMAMMGGSGLVNTMAQWFVSVSNVHTLPFWGLVSSFVINFFAPSAGGHWVIQGPFMIEAAKALGADMGKTAMAVMLGNAWNDLVQPFWLLPTLAISGLKLSDVMGYTVLCMLWTTLVFSVGVLLWGYM